MSKITEVVRQKKSASRRIKRFNVFLDGEFAFGADEDLVVNRRLVVGRIITEEELQKILFEAEVGKLMEKMYRWFSLRQHSEKEVREHLRIMNYELRIKNKEQISQLVIDAVIEVLKKKGMVNDLEFAKAWVDARRKIKKKGKIALKSELYQKGIDKDVIVQVLEQTTDESEEALAKEALESKIKLWQNLNSQACKQKAYEFLLRRGFEYEVVKKIVENRLKNR